MTDGSRSSGGTGAFDDIQARLDALLQELGGEPAVRAPEPEPEPEPEPIPEPVAASEPEPHPAPPRPTRRRPAAGDRAITGAIVAAILVVAALLLVTLLRGDGAGETSPRSSSIPDVRFPAAVSDRVGPEGREAPDGVRSLELDVEAAIVAVTGAAQLRGPRTGG